MCKKITDKLNVIENRCNDDIKEVLVSKEMKKIMHLTSSVVNFYIFKCNFTTS